MKRVVVQFGGTGDLALKKLYPAYEHLMEVGFEFTVIALGRRFPNRQEFLEAMVSPKASKQFLEHLEYLHYDMYAEEATKPLKSKIEAVIGGG